LEHVSALRSTEPRGSTEELCDIRWNVSRNPGRFTRPSFCHVDFSTRAAPPAGWGWSTGTVGAEDAYRSILDDRGQSTCRHGAISALNDDVVAVPGSSAVLLVSPNQMLYMLCPAASLRGLDQMLAVYWSRRPDGLSIESDALSERGTGRQQRARSSVDRASDFGSEGRGFESLRARHISS
jgi:hypothetical protein